MKTSFEYKTYLVVWQMVSLKDDSLLVHQSLSPASWPCLSHCEGCPVCLDGLFLVWPRVWSPRWELPRPLSKGCHCPSPRQVLIVVVCHLKVTEYFKMYIEEITKSIHYSAVICFWSTRKLYFMKGLEGFLACKGELSHCKRCYSYRVPVTSR